GLLLASMFANTLTMTGSDSNTISAVITRDILPILYKKIRAFGVKKMLMIARVTTFTFVLITLIIAFESGTFGGVIGLVVSWFAALLGPISIPMILGLLPWFKHSDSRAALLSILGGLMAFILSKIFTGQSLALEIAAPVATSLVIYVLFGLFSRKKVRSEERRVGKEGN